jgi:RimJ/RimL family protein N-acetyltransferase
MSDLDSLVKYANNPNIARNMTDKFPFPYTKEHGKAFIEFATQDNPIHIFAIEVNGEAVGGIGIHPKEDIHRKNAELGYWLAEPFWNRGIMSNAIKQIVDFGFETYPVERIYAMVFSTNIGSQKILEKNNFLREAVMKETIYKNEIFLDEWIYAVRRKDWKK